MKKFFDLGNKTNKYEYNADESIEWELAADEIDEEEYCSDESGEAEYYAEEVSEEEYYADESVEGEYYSGEYSEEEYYADEFEDEYYSDEYSEDEYYEDEWNDENWNGPVSAKFFDKIKYAIGNMDMVDRFVVCAGVVVLILALITGTVFASNHIVTRQVNSFATVGSQLDGIRVIGGDGLLAVADAQIARQEAALLLEEGQGTDSEGYDEEEYSNEVVVALNMTSIKKDLKIKFVNKKTGKLIPNVPFEVEVTDPKGKTTNWVDDDKDGIIYKTDIAHGEYSVAMVALEGYEDYQISTVGKAVNVKENLDYQKVDVSDEIKSESEIDASKEDTAQNDIEEESKLQDTVAWVESTKTPINENYVEIAKTTIDEPKVVRFDNFMKLVGSNGETVSISGDTSVGATGSIGLSASASNFAGDITYSWSVDNSCVTIEGSGSSVTLKANNADAAAKTVTVSVTATSTVTESVSGNETTTTYTDTATATVTVGAAEVTPEPQPTLTISQPTLSVQKGNTATLTATAGDVTTGFTWTSSDEAVATVDNSGVVTGVEAGNATITVSYTPEGGETLTATCEVTVTKPDVEVTLKLNKTTATIATKGKLELVPTLTGEDTVNNKIKWTSSDETIATVTGDNTKATITGVKAGEVKITASYTENNVTAVAECTIKVVDVTIKLDKSTGEVLVGEKLELKPTITGGDIVNNKIVWKSADETIATVKGDNTKAEITGVKAGEVKITASYTENGVTVEVTCTVKVKPNPALDTTTALKDKAGNQVYVKNAQGQYVAATYADYFKENQKFYLKQQGYKYTGWQTIDGRVYYFDANGNKVTGAQVIQGAQYSFDSNGIMVSSNGILGIDVSKWNGSIDWNAVKNSGVSYVIIRCGYRGSSQGSLIEDPKYKTNIQGATAAGLKVGVYFFTQAINEIEAVEEASMVLSLIKGYKISYPIFLDVESSGGRGDKIDKTTRTAVCKAFCQTIKNSGYTAGIYANKTWLNSYINTSQLSAYRIWLAQYAAQPTYTGRYDIWQYSSKGKVSGIKGDVDLNLSYMGY